MTKDEFYKGIALSKEAEQIAKHYQVDEIQQAKYWNLFQTDSNTFFRQILEGKDYRKLFLALFLQFAFSLQEEYKKRGIAETVFLDTFTDIPLWVSNCERDYGETGLEEYGWIAMHLNLKLFRLGRLQFELVEAFEEGFTYNKRSLNIGERALNLHIPQGEPLSLEGCLDSISQATLFFENIKEISCHSWLLSPALSDILGEDSNIVKFQRLFQIYELDPDSREAEERVFQNKVLEDPTGYMGHTTLQRKLKEYLIKGNKAGSAFGLLLK